MSALLSREQAASAEFLHASARLEDVARDDHGEGLAIVAGHLVQAINAFGLSELHARQADRFDAVGLYAEAAEVRRKLSQEHNEKGLRNLDSARRGVQTFRKELAGYPKAENIGHAVEAFRDDFRAQLAQLEVKASDVERLDGELREIFEVAAGGADGLPDYLEKHLGALDEARRSADRGTSENIPIWKVIAIVVAVGVWVWALFRCHWWGRCSLAEGLAYFVIFWIAALIARFC